jgi:hypothetical protein
MCHRFLSAFDLGNRPFHPQGPDYTAEKSQYIRFGEMTGKRVVPQTKRRQMWPEAATKNLPGFRMLTSP